jgi:hypothetical protein
MLTKTDLNERIKDIPIPDRMRRLPVSDRGFPIPKFVPYIDGKPEFRGMDGRHLNECIKRKLCWQCGEPLGVHMTFVMGPMCAINVNNAEPPNHYRCAEYAVKACPFLTQPRMRRNEKGMPDEVLSGATTAGIPIRRNPGVALLWTTRSYKLSHDRNGVLFHPDFPEHIEAYSEGREATLDEVMHSVATGVPILMEMAEKDGPEAVTLCQKMIGVGLRLLHQHLAKADTPL